MNSFRTKGIVLKRSNFSEADRILTIFTERFGKIKAIAKGVRKIKSHLAGSLEPFALLDLQLHEGKTFFTVTGASIEEDFADLHTDLKKLSLCFYLGELIDKFFEENQKSSVAFKNLVSALEYLEDKVKNNLAFKTFCLEIVEEAGFKPRIFQCVHCHKEAIEEDNFWDSVEGGIVCGDCKKTTGHGKSISKNAVKILRLLERKDFSVIEKVGIGPDLEEEVQAILDEYISSVLEKDLKSKYFISSLKAFDKNEN